MKKTLKIALALLLAIACVLPLVSCGAKPKLNLEKAEEKLEDNDYRVSLVDDEDDLEYGMLAYLSASAEKGDDTITIVKFKTKKLAKLYYKQAKLEIEQEIEALKLQIKIAKYELKKFDKDMDSDAEKYYEDYIEELEDSLKEAKESLDFIGRSGKYVWVATSKDVIKDTKKS